MNTDNYNRFDELIREKLDSYEAEADMDLLVNIHARKNRFLRSRNLLTIIALLAILMAGILGGYYLSHAGKGESRQENSSTDQVADKATQSRQTGFAGAVNAQSNYGDASYSSTLQGIPGSGLTSNKNSGYQQVSNSTPDARTGKPTVSSASAGQNNKPGVKANKDRMLYDVVIAADRIPAKNQSLTDRNAEQQHQQNDEKQNSVDKTKTTDECSASFSYYSSYDQSLNFMASVNAAPGVVINWQFGDGESSRELNPKHTYSKAGQYAVTLTAVNTQTNCKAEVYKLIRVATGASLTSSTIKGTVFADAEYAAKTMVQLIEPSTTRVIQTTFTNNKGHYEFNEIGAGNFVIRTSTYKNYSSTYYGNAEDVEQATNIAVFKDDYDVLSGYDIQMVANRALADNSSLKSDSGSRLMVVMDENNNPVTTVVVSANGKITSSVKLPAGNYSLLDPLSGQSGGSLNVGDDGSASMGPKSGTGFGNDMAENMSTVTLSPNPAGPYVNIGLTNANSSPIEVTIINYGGAIVRQFTLPNGSSSGSIDINSLSGGTYHVIVKQNGTTVTSTLVKASDNSK